MAEDADPDSKTEDPSGKRLADAAKQGNIARSQEIGHWFIFLAATIALWVMGDMLSRRVIGATLFFFEQPHRIPIDPSHLTQLAVNMAMDVGLVMAPVLGLFVVFSLAASIMQNKPQVTFEKLKPDISKLSPMAGLKRIFSVSGAVEFVKNLMKVGLIGAILFAILIPELDKLEALIDLDLSVILPFCISIVFKLLGSLIGIMAVVSVADYLYQRYNYIKQLRMTRQEVKDEHKETEGDPIIKARLRQLRMQRVRKRMMANVPQASVVVTNPTHYAVALKYEEGQSEAPIVVAKGVDVLARRIREIATEHDVPIVENPPLARALYKVELDEPIPIDHYRAVAEVISYVMRLKDGLTTKYEPKVETVE
ncbi:flagellar biosynthesis protein FlhB [Ferrovibrio sp.]|uniref:flagellar biosynthesis protein FlhB n=1 Tax=Ferrovibrio sp. TaxID=1917215 RepID=UPI00262635F0|nr:flagellar biosynthesis protein FlhB [Ferrovibrio sp.]